MELEEELEDPAGNITNKKLGGDKVHLTQVHDSTEEFLHKVFIPVNNAERRQLRQQYNHPRYPFLPLPSPGQGDGNRTFKEHKIC